MMIVGKPSWCLDHRGWYIGSAEVLRDGYPSKFIADSFPTEGEAVAWCLGVERSRSEHLELLLEKAGAANYGELERLSAGWREAERKLAEIQNLYHELVRTAPALFNRPSETSTVDSGPLDV